MGDLLSIGQSGLSASKKSLEVAGHNTANVNTEGYSRQKVLQSANAPSQREGLIQGAGVRVTGVVRVHNRHIEKNVLRHMGMHEHYKTHSEELGKIENIFNEIDHDGLGHALNQFFNAFRELSAQPENEAMRSIVREKAALLTKDFHRLSEGLTMLTRAIDQRLTDQVEAINGASLEIAHLNKQIASLEGIGHETGDLRDARDRAIRTLASFFEVQTYEDGEGHLNVLAKGVGTLVSGGHHQKLMARTVPKESSSDEREGSVEIFFQERPSTKATSRFQGGGVAALVTVRNIELKKLKESLDHLALAFGRAINTVHRRGMARRGGVLLHNIPLFDISREEGAASSLRLSSKVRDHPQAVMTGKLADAPGDNRIARGIAKLQGQKMMDNNTVTFEDYVFKLIGNLAVERGKAKILAGQSEGHLAQVKNLKEKISGVSLDEEAANIIRFQKAYRASAKVIQAADQMIETVLNLKR